MSDNISFNINGQKFDIQPCVNCGMKEFEMIDTLYPQNLQATEWVFGCMVHNGGCGRQVYGGTKKEVIDRWNKGYIDEFLI